MKFSMMARDIYNAHMLKSSLIAPPGIQNARTIYSSQSSSPPGIKKSPPLFTWRHPPVEPNLGQSSASRTIYNFSQLHPSRTYHTPSYPKRQLKPVRCISPIAYAAVEPRIRSTSQYRPGMWNGRRELVECSTKKVRWCHVMAASAVQEPLAIKETDTSPFSPPFSDSVLATRYSSSMTPPPSKHNPDTSRLSLTNKKGSRAPYSAVDREAVASLFLLHESPALIPPMHDSCMPQSW